MKRINNFNFMTKKRMLISINNSLIEGKIDENVLSNFDRVFSKMSKDELDYDIFLYNLWSEVKFLVRNKKNKETLKDILKLINNNLVSIESDLEINKVLVKVKGDNNE